jgi:hypothetical protein
VLLAAQKLIHQNTYTVFFSSTFTLCYEWSEFCSAEWVLGDVSLGVKQARVWNSVWCQGNMQELYCHFCPIYHVGMKLN